MEICNLTDKKFKIAVLRKLSELQENTESQLNKSKKRIHKQNEKFNREREIIKKNQREIPELITDPVEENICEVEDSIEIIQRGGNLKNEDCMNYGTPII